MVCMCVCVRFTIRDKVKNHATKSLIVIHMASQFGCDKFPWLTRDCNLGYSYKKLSIEKECNSYYCMTNTEELH